MEKTCIESTNYAHFKDNYKFAMTLEKLKAFLTILIVSGYAGLPRQEMYWQRVEDCHNLVVSAMMTKTEFLECKRCLIWVITTLSIVQITLQKCDQYLMLLMNNAF